MTQFLNEKEVAEMTRLALSTLRNARTQGKLIPYHKINRSVRYSLADVEAYMQAHRIVPRNEDGGA